MNHPSINPLCSFVFPIISSSSIFHATSPLLQRSQAIIYTAKTVDITASGGTTKKPEDSEGCPPWTSGDLKYKFKYSGIEGSPASGAEGTEKTLSLKRDLEGEATVTVIATQVWTDTKGATQTKESPESNSIKVVVQKPTAITFESGTAATDGANFTFSVKDQNDKLMKSQPMSLLEDVTGIFLYYYDDAGVFIDLVGPTSRPPGGVASSQGTDANGKITDHVHLLTPGALAQDAVDRQKSLLLKIEITSHAYHQIKGPDGTTYEVNSIIQQQSIHQKAIYNPTNNSATSSTIFVSPAN